ncbi:hypothetical protein BC833DRAFT_621058 [Globomyces pollinis-pini]|nr:hypothetical protein BC833DRAFT_621058 [Globomyces pollinis-pini]
MVSSLVNSVLAVSLVLGAHNLYLCINAALRKPLQINYVQVVASIFQLINQLWLFAFSNFKAKTFGMNCRLYQDIDFICFYIFQNLSIGVLIFRTTILIPKEYQKMSRIALVVVLLIASSFGIHSNAYRNTFVDNDGLCASIWFSTTNTIHVMINFFIYLALFGIFVIPAFNFYSNAHSNSRSSLGDILFSVSFRVAIAMMGFLISTIFAVTGVWGNNFQIEFSLENYCSITASTFAIKADGSATNQLNSTIKSIRDPSQYNTGSTLV